MIKHRKTRCVAFRYTPWFCVSQRNMQNEIAFSYSAPNDRGKTIAKLVVEGRYLYPYIPEGVYAELRAAMSNLMCMMVTFAQKYLGRYKK